MWTKVQRVEVFHNRSSCRWPTNADEAILLLEARRDITVVFTDVEMPGSMHGFRLA
jgi:hypothetical protein